MEALEALMEEVKGLKKTVEGKATALEAASASIASQGEQITKLQAAVEAATASSDALKTELKGATDKIAELSKALEAAQAKITATETQIKDSDTRTLMALGKLGFRADDEQSQSESKKEQASKPGLSPLAASYEARIKSIFGEN